ncbi:MAG: hypothetical protein ACYCV7_05110 [Acidimicrobiales bacterium]
MPACGTSVAQVEKLWPGKRLYAFEEPYIDLYGIGRYAPGDPFCDATHSGYYQGLWLAGGSSGDRSPTSVQPGNPLQAEAVVFSLHGQRKAMVVVDSIGLFNVTMDQIRADAARMLAARGLPPVGQVFVSSTHDESAPDPIGLWGPDLTGTPAAALTGSAPAGTGVTSGVDSYYLNFLAAQAASAIVAADSHLAPSVLRLTVAHLPSNVQTCWSSYPYIDNQLIPIMQGVNTVTGRPIFTLVNGNSHVETFAFSGVASEQAMMSADWAGLLRSDLAAAYPGSVGIEMSGLVGSVETPSVYQPASTQVINVPGKLHGVPNPDGCNSVYPNPTTGTPVTSASALVTDYASAMASTVTAALASHSRTVAVHQMSGQHTRLCVQLENNLFAAAFAAGMFPQRPAYADPTCSVGARFNPTNLPVPAYHLAPGHVWGPSPLWLKTDVGVLTVGPAQFSYTPGEVFPVAQIRGHIDAAQMPFPTTCYHPALLSGIPNGAPNGLPGPPGPGVPTLPTSSLPTVLPQSYTCGSAMPMTPWITADMTQPYKFMAGLGEDMIGYLMPPADFVGTAGEVNENPWLTYENTNQTGQDRFGYGHSDDAESIGPHAGLAVTQALARLLAADGHGLPVLPGLYVDSSGRLSDTPFAGSGFSGAVGVEVVLPTGKTAVYGVGPGTGTRWANFDGMPDAGTPGTSLPYSVSTAGVILPSGKPLLVDVYAGAARLTGGPSAGGHGSPALCVSASQNVVYPGPASNGPFTVNVCLHPSSVPTTPPVPTTPSVPGSGSVTVLQGGQPLSASATVTSENLPGAPSLPSAP